ncbi:MAG: hypothetical protein K2P32_04430, partial [Clostridia bacterium]|nr:hypothetical protein [Clostridia bacterium]
MLNNGNKTFIYDKSEHGGELSVVDNALGIDKITATYYKDSVAIENKLESAPINSGSYIVVLTLSGDGANNYTIKQAQIEYRIDKVKIIAKWNMSGNTPVISNLDESLKDIVGYVYYDVDGNELAEGTTLEKGKTYKVKAIITGDNGINYEFVAEDGETVLDEPTATEEKEFTVGNNGSGGNGNIVGSIEDIKKLLEGIPLWQIIVATIGLILTIAFLAKMSSCESKRKKAKKKIDKYTTYYSGMFLGLAFVGWTAIALSLVGTAVVSFAGMLISMRRQSGAEDELEEAKEEYERNRADVEAKRRDENMQMMFMHMMGGNGGQGAGQGGYVQQGLGAEEMRGLISETVTAMLPGMQQMLPQQASVSDEILKQLADEMKNNREDIRRNEEAMR